MMFLRFLEQKLKKLLRNKIFIIWGKEVDMVALYCVLIINGRRTFDQVPAKLQDAVREMLAEMGLDENGNPAGSNASMRP